MKQALTIARRELSSLFCSPIAYVVLGVFALGTTLIFANNFFPGLAASLRDTFTGLIWLLIFLVPAISMRLISEEFRSGTVETLLTTPVSDTQIILGKWLGAMGFFLVLLTPLIVLAMILELNGEPDWGPIISGLIGLLLVGGLYLAIGTFASALTQNQIIAFLVTVSLICLLTIALYFIPRAAWVPPGLSRAMMYANVNEQFATFNKGLLAIPNLVYFASTIGLFLFMAIKTLESRRWR